VNVRRCLLFTLVCATVTITGCYAVEESAEKTVIRFSPMSRLAMIAVPLFLLLVGFILCLFRATRVAGLLGICATVLLGVLVLPGMYMDTVVITPTGITQTTGLWFSPTVKGFQYADVRSVSILKVQKQRRTARIWVVQYNNGTTEEIDPGDLWEFNEELVVKKLRGFGVKFE